MADTDETTARSNGGNARNSAGAAIRDTANRVREATAPEAQSLEDQVAQLQTDLKSITNTLARMGQTAGNEVKHAANQQAEHLAARGQSAINYAQDEFGAVEKQIKDTIREKPLTAVAGAVALGFLIAVLTR